MGIGDWGLGIAIPNPQSPIPNITFNTFNTFTNNNTNTLYLL